MCADVTEQLRGRRFRREVKKATGKRGLFAQNTKKERVGGREESVETKKC